MRIDMHNLQNIQCIFHERIKIPKFKWSKDLALTISTVIVWEGPNEAKTSPWMIMNWNNAEFENREVII